MKKGLVAAGIVSVLAIAAPAFAQSYPSYYGNTGYTNSYYPQQSYSYLPAQAGGTPLIYQPVTMPSYNNYAPITIPNYGQMNSYSTNQMQAQQQYQYPAQQQPSYNYAPSYYPSQNYSQQYYPQQNYNQQPSYYPQQNYSQQNAQQYYPYTNTYRNANSYPMYNVSQPEYDPTYANFSNYYTQYPHKVGVYTGNTDLFGTPLCNWPGGYKGYDCGSDPSQPVYDPYSGTWY